MTTLGRVRAELIAAVTKPGGGRRRPVGGATNERLVVRPRRTVLVEIVPGGTQRTGASTNLLPTGEVDLVHNAGSTTTWPDPSEPHIYTVGSEG